MIGAEQGKSHFTMIPNIVRELGLPVHALGFYFHIVSTAGWTGQCSKASRTLAKALHCSAGSITNAKRELQRRHCMLAFKPLIQINSVPRRQGGKPRHVITLVDIWSDNSRHFADREARGAAGRLPDATPNSGDDNASSPHALGSSPRELASPSREIKKNSRRKTIEGDTPSLSPSVRENERGYPSSEIEELWGFVKEIFGRTDNRPPSKKERRLLNAILPVSDDERALVDL